MPNFQIDEDLIQKQVPGLLKLVTKRLAFDVEDALTKLSKKPVRPQGKGKKKEARKAGNYRDNRKGAPNKWVHLSAAYHKGWDVLLIAYLNTVTDNVRKIVFGEDWKESKSDLVFMNYPALDTKYVETSPDFVLVSREHAESKTPSWSEIYCVGVLNYGDIFKYDREEAIRTLGKYAGKCFYRSHIQRFVIGLAFHQTRFFLCVFDRSGALVSERFDIDVNPRQFLQGVACLPLLSPADLGLDPTVHDKDGSRYFRVEGKQYKVLKNLHVTRPMIGKGTICYEVEGEDGKVFAARDCWTPDGSTMREAQFLELVKDMKHIPRIVAQEIVKVESDTHKPFLDKTSRLRETLRGLREHIFSDDWAYTQRDHLRTTYWPCGQDLHDFESLAELTSALPDVFETIETLYNRDMLHSDISPGNILLVPTEGSPFRRGYLIDFETAVKADSKLFKPVPYFTPVTTSSDVLLGFSSRNVIHEAESVILSLLILSLTLAGPRDSPREGSQYQNNIFCIARPTRMQVKEKQLVLESSERFRDEVLRDIHPYFSPLKNCLEGLRGIMYGPQESLDAETCSRLSDKVSRTEQMRTTNDAVLAKCKNLLRETLAKLTTDEGLIHSKVKEADEISFSENSAAEEKDELRGPEQTKPKPGKDEEHNIKPTPVAINVADQPTGGNKAASPGAQNIPHTDMSQNEDLKAQKTAVKRSREEEDEPLQDVTNEDRQKRIKLHKAKEEEPEEESV